MSTCVAAESITAGSFDWTDYLQVTPSIQYVSNPANDLDTDSILVLGARVRVFF